MPTPWFYPTVVSQYPESDYHIPWLGTGNDFTSIVQVRTKSDLTSVANDLQLSNLRTKSYYLTLTGFGIDPSYIPSPLNGIELYVNVRRGGRVIDDTVSLYYSNQTISTNRAQGAITDLTTYGGETDLWDAVPMISTLLTDPSFGVLLRYQSNVFWPHRTTPNMQHVQLRLW
jgi:hypothetical protein